ARAIRSIVREKRLKAAVNFQLRFSPKMLAAADAINRGMIGELLEIDVEVNIFTPWHMFPFLEGADRVELSLHSIHYLDMIRALAGNPASVFCRSMSDPRSPTVTQTRTSAILDYGGTLRVLMNINHNHSDQKFQHATFRIEGMEGEMMIKMGVLYDYPQGEPDELWIRRKDSDWRSIPLNGTWFPDAFVGKMSNVLRCDGGEDEVLVSEVEDAFGTMALVEACFDANDLKGVVPAQA
ncbi:MAG: Gfo/Idh/MocA family protein, partial [Rhizobiaceae bacterium]